MYYKDYKIINKWWVKKFSILVSSKTVEFDTLEELKEYVDGLY